MTEESPASRRVRLPRHGTIGTLAVLAMVPAWLGLAGGWWWFLDLFANFRWQYLIASILIAAWAMWLRQRRILALALLTLLLNVVLIGRLAWHPVVDRASLSGDFSMRVVSLNVHTSNTDKQAVLDYLLAADADVVFLMEVDEAWITALAGLQVKYPHHLLEPRDDNFGVALFSREPWQQAGVVSLGSAGVPSIQVRTNHQGRDLVILGTHPVPPVSGEHAQRRNEQLTALADHVRGISQPVLVVGDFNATPWSVGLRLATSGNLGFRALAAPWQPTWEARSILAIPIDHALCTAPLVITSRSAGPDVGSDHRPLEIALATESGR